MRNQALTRLAASNRDAFVDLTTFYRHRAVGIDEFSFELTTADLDCMTKQYKKTRSWSISKHMDKHGRAWTTYGYGHMGLRIRNGQNVSSSKS